MEAPLTSVYAAIGSCSHDKPKPAILPLVTEGLPESIYKDFAEFYFFNELATKIGRRIMVRNMHYINKTGRNNPGRLVWFDGISDVVLKGFEPFNTTALHVCEHEPNKTGVITKNWTNDLAALRTALHELILEMTFCGLFPHQLRTIFQTQLLVKPFIILLIPVFEHLFTELGKPENKMLTICDQANPKERVDKSFAFLNQLKGWCRKYWSSKDVVLRVPTAAAKVKINYAKVVMSDADFKRTYDMVGCVYDTIEPPPGARPLQSSAGLVLQPKLGVGGQLSANALQTSLFGQPTLLQASLLSQGLLQPGFAQAAAFAQPGILGGVPGLANTVIPGLNAANLPGVSLAQPGLVQPLRLPAPSVTAVPTSSAAPAASSSLDPSLPKLNVPGMLRMTMPKARPDMTQEDYDKKARLRSLVDQLSRRLTMPIESRQEGTFNRYLIKGIPTCICSATGATVEGKDAEVIASDQMARQLSRFGLFPAEFLDMIQEEPRWIEPVLDATRPAFQFFIDLLLSEHYQALFDENLPRYQQVELVEAFTAEITEWCEKFWKNRLVIFNGWDLKVPQDLWKAKKFNFTTIKGAEENGVFGQTGAELAQTVGLPYGSQGVYLYLRPWDPFNREGWIAPFKVTTAIALAEKNESTVPQNGNNNIETTADKAATADSDTGGEAVDKIIREVRARAAAPLKALVEYLAKTLGQTMQMNKFKEGTDYRVQVKMSDLPYALIGGADVSTDPEIAILLAHQSISNRLSEIGIAPKEMLDQVMEDKTWIEPITQAMLPVFSFLGYLLSSGVYAPLVQHLAQQHSEFYEINAFSEPIAAQLMDKLKAATTNFCVDYWKGVKIELPCEHKGNGKQFECGASAFAKPTPEHVLRAQEEARRKEEERKRLEEEQRRKKEAEAVERRRQEERRRQQELVQQQQNNVAKGIADEIRRLNSMVAASQNAVSTTAAYTYNPFMMGMQATMAAPVMSPMTQMVPSFAQQQPISAPVAAAHQSLLGYPRFSATLPPMQQMQLPQQQMPMNHEIQLLEQQARLLQKQQELLQQPGIDPDLLALQQKAMEELRSEQTSRDGGGAGDSRNRDVDRRQRDRDRDRDRRREDDRRGDRNFPRRDRSRDRARDRDARDRDRNREPERDRRRERSHGRGDRGRR